MLFGDIYDEEDDGDERVTSWRNSHFDRFELREDGAPDEETKRPKRLPPLKKLTDQSESDSFEEPASEQIISSKSEVEER